MDLRVFQLDVLNPLDRDSLLRVEAKSGGLDGQMEGPLTLKVQ